MLTSTHSRSICPPASAPMSLARPPARLTTTAWSPQGQLTVADWVSQGRWLGALGRASGWWIGDWIRYGNARYGERYAPAAQVTGYDMHSLRNMAYVAGRFEGPRRRESLSFSHHAELAGLTTEEQELWLDRAEAGALSVRVLRSELRQARRRAASRAALAEARQRRDQFASTTANEATFNGGLDGTSAAGSPLAARRLAHGARRSSDMGESASGAARELVCPECGCRFAQPSPVVVG